LNLAVSPLTYKAAEALRFAAVATAAQIKAIAAAAQFILSAKDAIDNYKKLRNISSRGISLEEQQQAFLETNYWPKETAFVDEYTQPTAWETRPVLAKRYAGRMWAPFANQMGREMHKLSCDRGRYCGSAFKRKAQELTVQYTNARANITLLADRIAEAEIEAVRDTDFDRRQKAIALRQGLVGQATALMAEAQRGFAGAAGNAVGGLNSAISTLGYLWQGRENAQNGIGADPRFHRQVRDAVGRGPMDIDMGTTPQRGYGPMDIDMGTTPQYSAFDDASSYSANFDTGAMPGSHTGAFSSFPDETPGLGVNAESTPFTSE
jgi:hypothetical protein